MIIFNGSFKDFGGKQFTFNISCTPRAGVEQEFYFIFILGFVRLM